MLGPPFLREMNEAKEPPRGLSAGCFRHIDLVAGSSTIDIRSRLPVVAILAFPQDETDGEDIPV